MKLKPSSIIFLHMIISASKELSAKMWEDVSWVNPLYIGEIPLSVFEVQLYNKIHDDKNFIIELKKEWSILSADVVGLFPETIQNPQNATVQSVNTIGQLAKTKPETMTSIGTSENLNQKSCVFIGDFTNEIDYNKIREEILATIQLHKKEGITISDVCNFVFNNRDEKFYKQTQRIISSLEKKNIICKKTRDNKSYCFPGDGAN